MTEPALAVRVAVVEDHGLFRSMLETTLTGAPGIRVVSSSPDVTDARARIRPGMVDVALLDVELPDGNGVGLGVQLRRADPKIRIVLLSAEDVMDLLLDLPDDVAGDWSYLSKTSTSDAGALVAAIRHAAAGGTTLDPTLLARYRPRAGTPISRLTDRQYAVLRLLAEGLSNAGIGARLEIAEKSVQNHVNAIYSTLGIDASPERNPRVTAALRLLDQTARP